MDIISKPLDFDVYFTETDEGTFVAATNVSPYFWLEADSETALLSKLEAALTFYLNHEIALSRAPTPPTTYRDFRPRKRVNARELVAA